MTRRRRSRGDNYVTRLGSSRGDNWVTRLGSSTSRCRRPALAGRRRRPLQRRPLSGRSRRACRRRRARPTSVPRSGRGKTRRKDTGVSRGVTRSSSGMIVSRKCSKRSKMSNHATLQIISTSSGLMRKGICRPRHRKMTRNEFGSYLARLASHAVRASSLDC